VRAESRTEEPASKSPKDDCFDQLKGKIQIIGDIVAPIVPAGIWQYDLNNLDSEPRD
jgi:hypothetical protein